MSLSRWERLTRWAVKKTKSKPAQLAISIAAGGSFAAGFHWVGSIALNVLPAGAFVSGLEVILYLLTALTFVATTVLTGSGLAVSFQNTDLLSQTVINLSKKMLKMTRILAQRKELLDHLVNAEKIQNQNFREHVSAIHQLLGVADVLTKNITNPEQRAYCEKLLMPIGMPTAPTTADVLTQSEPYLEEELHIDIRDEEYIGEMEEFNASNELEPIRSQASIFQYGSLFTDSPASDASDDLDADLERAMSRLSLNVTSPTSNPA